MRRLPGILALFALLTLLPASLAAGSLVVSKSVEIVPGQVDYTISESPIISGSEAVYADTLLLARGVDYRLDCRKGILSLLRFPAANYLRVSFILIPPRLIQKQYLYEVLPPSDSLFKSIAPRKREWLGDDGKLLISGAKTFALTFSDDEAFDLKQSLYVNLNGELSRNVNIAAQLSDSQSKLTPEGDSKELSSLDRVFIRVFGRQYELAMGDLDWKFEGTRYINYQTSIEGLNAWYSDRHYLQAGYTATGGKSASQTIAIIDGKQGPYYLNPTGFQSTFLIIAGSEKIYRNGNLLERGTDYYIDYSEGSVMFRTLVVSSDLVNAFFQYSDDYYNQSTYFNSSRLQILPGLALSHHFIHQADAKDSPLLYDFTPADLDSLRNAGDRIVWGAGVAEVAAGQGAYIRKFTNEGIAYYEYAPTDSTASYNVTFSYVGSGNGDYEEFSSGKFRYVGSGLGAWLPQKRLIPAVKRSNADLALKYENRGFELGVEGIYTANDKNTFSKNDDSDNASGRLYAYGIWKTGAPDRETYLKLAWEKKWNASYLFAQNVDSGAEYDLALLPAADSLAQQQVDLTLGSRAWNWWKPELTLRYKDIPDLYLQRALRLVSRTSGKGLLPALDLRSTLSAQAYRDSDTPNSLLQFHDLSSSWALNWLKAKLLFTYNALEYAQPSALYIGNRYYKFTPQIALGDAKTTLSQVSVTWDDTSLQTDGWNSISNSRTYTLKHSTTTRDHNVNLDLTHREIRKQGENPRSNYDLVTFRDSHNFLKQAVMLLGNYQLNQTEFYPKIRELEYIGDGLGLYDSTGVYTSDGDWDYVYITSDQGTLSTEINGQLSLYLKPGNYFPKWQRVHSDVILQATEQGSGLSDWRSYVFYPGYVFNAGSTIYGKQSLNSALWVDIVANRVLGSIGFDAERSLDNRYQSLSRTSDKTFTAELDFKQFWSNNFNLKYELGNETDTRYMSDITRQDLELLAQRNLSANSLLTVTLSGGDEKGLRQSGTESYQLRGIGLKPGYRGVWGKKGRLSGSFGLRYNERSGSDFLTFLPDKRAGLLLDWNISAIYRLNSFSSASLEYTGKAYPDQDASHSLKMEFKAEL